MTDQKRVVALGFFDGVHLGHQALMRTARERAAQLNATASVITFDAHPDEVVFGRPVRLLGDLEDRKELIRRVGGIDDITVYHFDDSFMRTPWQEFIQSMKDELGAVHLVMGEDFRCGWHGEGTSARLTQWCEENGLGCDVVKKVILNGVTVSSTYVRELIAAGDVERAARYLGHPFVIRHRVEHGCQRGRRIGAPTINIPLPCGVAVPKFGVYITRVWRDMDRFPSVTNVGVRPTFQGAGAVTVETNILDFSDELYGETVRVEFLRFLRPERRYPDAASLAEQIQHDIAASRRWFQTEEGAVP